MKEGMAKTNELYIFNESAKIKVDIVYNIIEDKIKGNLFFYEDEKIYLKAELSGNINNPKINATNVFKLIIDFAYPGLSQLLIAKNIHGSIIKNIIHNLINI